MKQKTISLAELYERLIILETKLDLLENNQGLGRKHSTKLATLILIGIFVDIAIHLALFVFIER